MDYQRIYNQIIENRKQNLAEGYIEKHHIIPRSLGGTDDKENLVKLTAREHFICHYLLAKMYKKETFNWYKMNHAFLMMKCGSITNFRYFNSRLYNALKCNRSALMSIVQSGKNNSQHGSMWICNTELKENKKIKKEDEIPEGWIKGRNKWNIILLPLCKICNKELETKHQTYCSECRPSPFKDKVYISVEKHDKELFFKIYDEHLKTNLSLHKLAKKYGFPISSLYDYRDRYFKSIEE